MFLQQRWFEICQYTQELDLPVSQWQFQWSCNQSSAARLYKAVKIFKPRVIVETGTFEAIGTFAIAKAAHENANNALIFTIDYDGDPTTILPQCEWKKLAEIRETNLNFIRSQFTNLNINFIEGDSREVLPKIFSGSVTEWDFFYQDSMHYLEGILSEWSIMKPFAKKGSVAVFDDLFLPDYPTLLSNKLKKIVKRNFLQRVDEYSQYQFPEFFFWQESFLGRWKCQSIVDSHPQLWAQKS